MQREPLDAVFVGRLDRNRHFFDRARVVIAPPRAHQRNLRRIGLARLNEKVLADANRLACLDAGNVVYTILVHPDFAVIDIVSTARKLNLLPVIELNPPSLQRPVGCHIQLGFGARNRAQIAAALLRIRRQASPRR